MATLVGRAGATRGTVVIYFLPVVATLLGVAFRDESVGAAAAVGLTLIVAGAYLTSRREAPPLRRASEPRPPRSARAGRGAPARRGLALAVAAAAAFGTVAIFGKFAFRSGRRSLPGPRGAVPPDGRDPRRLRARHAKVGRAGAGKGAPTAPPRRDRLRARGLAVLARLATRAGGDGGVHLLQLPNLDHPDGPRRRVGAAHLAAHRPPDSRDRRGGRHLLIRRGRARGSRPGGLVRGRGRRLLHRGPGGGGRSSPRHVRAVDVHRRRPVARGDVARPGRRPPGESPGLGGHREPPVRSS